LSTSNNEFKCPMCKGTKQIPQPSEVDCTAVKYDICPLCGGSGTLSAIEIKILS